MSDTTFNPIEQLVESFEEDNGDLMLCRCCTAPITHCGEKIDIGVTNTYRFTNPAGITYSITCYRNAPGCAILGIPTEEHSWFGGYYWQLANCDECGEHLGWYYQNNSERFFFGLIKERLILEEK